MSLEMYMRFRDKQEVREYVWRILEDREIAAFPKPIKGRIPNFNGSDVACNRLAELREFSSAHCVFCTPDYVLTRARELVLRKRKTLAVATPHMKKFLEVKKIDEDCIVKASSIRGFELFGDRLNTKVDFMIQGSVGVDKVGNRIGKGHGYGDREYHVLNSLNMMNSKAKVATVVHKDQIFDDFSGLMIENDVKVDFIITPEEIIETQSKD
jgi:5-formyltetrahydrofolate cyclo-ligase